MEGVSVIVCCYNSADRLPRTLRCLADQKTPNDVAWEIVLVDNASTDGTEAIARELWKRFGRSDVPLHLSTESRQGLAFARATGVKKSKFDYIIFCDDDNHLNQDYVANAISLMKTHPEVGAAGGVGIPMADSSLPDWFEKHKFAFACYEQGIAEGELVEPSASLYGAGLVVRKKVLDVLQSINFLPVLGDRTGGSLSSGGDTELCYAIRLMGYKLWYSEKLEFQHYLPPVRLTERYLLRLNQSLSLCSARLLVYRYALQRKEVTADIWWKDFAYSLWSLVTASVGFLRFQNPLFERRLFLDFSHYKLIGIMMQFGKYKSHYQRIRSIKEGV